MTDLERRYRRLLLAYPRWYRQRRGEEILTTLLEGSRPGQRRPAAGQAVALLVHGTATRPDLSEGGALGATAAAAASSTLTAAASAASSPRNASPTSRSDGSSASTRRRLPPGWTVAGIGRSPRDDGGT